MPRSTLRYGFEVAVVGWAGGFRGGNGFFAVLDEAGAIVHVVDGTQPASGGVRIVGAEVGEALRAEHARWIWFDPFDLPEWMAIEWQGVTVEAFERVIGRPFGDADRSLLYGAPGEPIAAIPTSWHVMM